MKELTINVEVRLKINRWYVTAVGLRNLKDKGNILLGMPVLYVLVERGWVRWGLRRALGGPIDEFVGPVLHDLVKTLFEKGVEKWW